MEPVYINFAGLKCLYFGTIKTYIVEIYCGADLSVCMGVEFLETNLVAQRS